MTVKRRLTRALGSTEIFRICEARDVASVLAYPAAMQVLRQLLLALDQEAGNGLQSFGAGTEAVEIGEGGIH